MEKYSKLKACAKGLKNSVDKIFDTNFKVCKNLGKLEEKCPMITLPLIVGSGALMVQSALITAGGVVYAVINPSPLNTMLGLGVSVAGLITVPLSMLAYADTWGILNEVIEREEKTSNKTEIQMENTL